MISNSSFNQSRSMRNVPGWKQTWVLMLRGLLLWLVVGMLLGHAARLELASTVIVAANSRIGAERIIALST